MRTTAKALLISLRPRQWVKNLFVVAPLIFSTHLFELERVVESSTAFVVFCLISGAVYLINDIVDIHRDKLHPEKSKRPLASGSIGMGMAVTASVTLVIAGFFSAFLLNYGFFTVVFSYLLLNVAYSFYLKSIVILDVMCVAAGFILRVLGGAVAVSIQPTPWILICTALLALFLAFGKRRHELVNLERKSNTHRGVLEHYSPYYLDQMIAVVTASTLMSYILYTISDETVQRFGSTKLLLTVPFVVYGIFRYLYLIHKKGVGGDPTNTLINDLPLIINVALWAVCSSVLVYFIR
jgi:4-hydroxybenzoate polyprenyltransferase